MFIINALRVWDLCNWCLSQNPELLSYLSSTLFSVSMRRLKRDGLTAVIHHNVRISTAYRPLVIKRLPLRFYITALLFTCEIHARDARMVASIVQQVLAFCNKVQYLILSIHLRTRQYFRRRSQTSENIQV